jgi:hypothetical protein
MIQEYVWDLARFIFGVREYREAFWSKSRRGKTWPRRFWGRIGIAVIAIVFFSSQQFGHGFLEFMAYAVLVIGLAQAAAPLFYLVLRFVFLFFITETYKRDLAREKWPEPWKSMLVLMSEAVLIVLSALGFLPRPWFVLLVFFWSIPVALFYLILPSFVLWGLGNRMFLTLAQFDDQLERPGEQSRSYDSSANQRR